MFVNVAVRIIFCLMFSSSYLTLAAIRTADIDSLMKSEKLSEKIEIISLLPSESLNDDGLKRLIQNEIPYVFRKLSRIANIHSEEANELVAYFNKILKLTGKHLPAYPENLVALSIFRQLGEAETWKHYAFESIDKIISGERFEIRLINFVIQARHNQSLKLFWGDIFFELLKISSIIDQIGKSNNSITTEMANPLNTSRIVSSFEAYSKNIFENHFEALLIHDFDIWQEALGLLDQMTLNHKKKGDDFLKFFMPAFLNHFEKVAPLYIKLPNVLRVIFSNYYTTFSNSPRQSIPKSHSYAEIYIRMLRKTDFNRAKKIFLMLGTEYLVDQMGERDSEYIKGKMTVNRIKKFFNEAQQPFELLDFKILTDATLKEYLQHFSQFAADNKNDLAREDGPLNSEGRNKKIKDFLAQSSAVLIESFSILDPNSRWEAFNYFIKKIKKTGSPKFYKNLYSLVIEGIAFHKLIPQEQLMTKKVCQNIFKD